MKREFVEDGWRFRITRRSFSRQPNKAKVQFYDNSLHHHAEVEDVYSFTEAVEYEETVENEHTLFGHTLWTSTDTVTKTRSMEETVEAAMERAWSKIENIDQSPSEQFDDAVRNVRGGAT